MEALKNEFKTWLQTLGFAESTVKSLPQYIAEMLLWLESQKVKEVQDITAEQIKTFFFQWKQRKNKTTGAGLSIPHINKNVLAINKFIEFLNKTGKHTIALKLDRETGLNKVPQVLTQAEVQALYQATYSRDTRTNPEAFGQRDRAMLTVFYGCGLRKNEGVHLEVNDVLKEKNCCMYAKEKVIKSDMFHSQKKDCRT